jgi:hypothetical protein
MTDEHSWRRHTVSAIAHIKDAMAGIQQDPQQAWKEGLLIEALQRLDSALMDEAQETG